MRLLRKVYRETPLDKISTGGPTAGEVGWVGGQ